MALTSILDAPKLTKEDFFKFADEYFSKLTTDDKPFMEVSFQKAPFDMIDRHRYSECLSVMDDEEDKSYGFMLVAADRERRSDESSRVFGLINIYVKDGKIHAGVISDDDDNYLKAAAGFLRYLSWNTELYYYDPTKHEENGLVTRYTNSEPNLRTRLENGFIPSLVINLDENGMPIAGNLDEVANQYFGFIHIYTAVNPVVEKKVGVASSNPLEAKFYGKKGGGKCPEITGLSAMMMCQTVLDAFDDEESSDKLMACAEELGSNIDTFKKDAEIKDLKDLNDEYVRENESLKSRLSSLEVEVENLKALTVKPNYQAYGNRKAEVGLGLKTDEKDLYAGEIQDILLKLINKEIASMSGSNDLERSRKYTVLKDIAEKNQLTGEDKRLTDFIKNTIGAKDFHVNAAFRGKLKSEGFEMDESHDHPKIWFKDDSRFCCVIAATPGDSRGPLNTASDFSKLLFGC